MVFADALVPFGFTALESEIYVFLLGHSPATGYKIAQGISKPAANTYKALQTLQSKGAILVEDGSNRMCRAVALEELMNRLQKEFESQKSKTIKALKDAGKPQDDSRLYILKSRDQILNRVREMLGSAKTSVLIKLPINDVRAIEGAIEKSAERGVSVAVLTNESIAIEGVEVAWTATTLDDQVCAVSDGDQTLAGQVPHEGESEAIWTRNISLARVHHQGVSAEIALAQVSALLAADEKKGRIQKAVESRPLLP